ncbi:MAG: hypothetical protein E6Q67_05045 [Roseateles sp.]|nr:MAG: hypothetical protein E6Q67_05045 [Roseateles sp.]
MIDVLVRCSMDPSVWLVLAVSVLVCALPAGLNGRAALVALAGESEAALKQAKAAADRRYLPILDFFTAKRRIEEVLAREQREKLLSRIGHGKGQL